MKDGKSITIIAAMGLNRAIGLDGSMPWHLPGELQHFKETTMGKPIVMGRKTWESIGRALPGRQNLVVTRKLAYEAEGCEMAASLEQAIKLARGEEIMIIGGGELYAQALEFTDRMVLTLVDSEPQADTWFPLWSEQEWEQTASHCVAADENNPLAYRVIELFRRSACVKNDPEPGITGHPQA